MEIEDNPWRTCGPEPAQPGLAACRPWGILEGIQSKDCELPTSAHHNFSHKYSMFMVEITFEHGAKCRYSQPSLLGFLLQDSQIAPETN